MNNNIGQHNNMQSEQNEVSALRGGNWSNSSNAGVGAVLLFYYRSHSDTGVGGRACIIV